MVTLLTGIANRLESDTCIITLMKEHHFHDVIYAMIRALGHTTVQGTSHNILVDNQFLVFVERIADDMG